jgi:hypothetical protein
VLYPCLGDVNNSWAVAQAGFQLTIFLPQTPQCWNYRHTPHIQP